ncbi:kallikrein-4-like [Schistocerca piceifrons]|uniref:kallikrein-4-like n=1 Tax=Schistocerca piceifrons TaxID=274613 RepID=UPI001F5EFEEF|nr:kallikrein-4-like [Schistocerca piceifrons]
MAYHERDFNFRDNYYYYVKPTAAEAKLMDIQNLLRFLPDTVKGWYEELLDREQSQDGLQDSQRIYVHGGRPVERGEFPFLALLEIAYGEGVMACSGSIPSPTTVLSSAHCDVGTITAYAGLVNNTDMDLEDGKTQARYVESVTKPSYPKFYDIMICYVNESWIWSEFVAPIALYLNETSMQPSFVIDCQVLGFGQTMPDGPVGVAHVMKQLVGSSSQCAHLHPILWFFSFWMCSVDVNNKTMCQGDSGGPVMCSTATGFKQWAVNMGVAPAEKECLPQKTANVYVSTAYFRSWILDNIRDLASCAGSVRRGSIRIFTRKGSRQDT